MYSTNTAEYTKRMLLQSYIVSYCVISQRRLLIIGQMSHCECMKLF